jgi:hypothetical protein
VNKKLIGSLIMVAVLGTLGGCAVTTGGVYRPYTPTAVAQPGAGVVEEDCDYTSNDECTQVEVAAYPGVIFNSRYVDECPDMCPIAFYNGAWINYLGVPIVYRGFWGRPPSHVINSYRGFARDRGHLFRPAPHFRPGGGGIRPGPGVRPRSGGVVRPGGGSTGTVRPAPVIRPNPGAGSRPSGGGGGRPAPSGGRPNNKK